MKKYKKILASFALAIATLASALGCHVNAFAADEVDYHLGIVPTQSNLGTINPGESYSGEFKVKNQGKKTAEYVVDFAPYSIKNEQYEPVYDQATAYTEIAKWITTSQKSGVIEPGAEDIIRFTVDVPEDAHGGAQSAIIIVRLKQDGESSGTSIQAVQQLGYLVFGNVDGDIVETANILENKIPGFLFKAPLYAESVVENTGNVYSNAEYTLQVFPLFSDEEIYTTEEDPSREVIFPETKRYNKVAWEGSPQLGIYRVRQTVKLFDQTSTAEKLVFICPLWFLFICIAVIFIILFSIIHHLRHRE